MKRDRSSFLYMEPRAPKDGFAQCKTCRLYVPERARCAVLGEALEVRPVDSCGLYVWGAPRRQDVFASASPGEAGFTRRTVRCENCYSFDAGVCWFFRSLETKMPEIFDLGGGRVAAQACCNAWVPAQEDF